MRLLGRTLPSSLAVLTLLGAAASQKPARWKIPFRGVLFYQREASSVPDNMHTGSRFLPGFGVNNPPVLLQGELDPTQRFLEEDPGSLWELAMHQAFDLRLAHKAGTIDHTCRFLTDFGSIRVKGTASRIREDGRQVLELTLERVPLPSGKYPPRVLEFLNDKNGHKISGKLRIVRRYDQEHGRVTHFKSEMRLKIDGRDARLSEDWSFQEAKPCRYPGFTQQVADAIARGGEHIRAQVGDLTRKDLAAAPDHEGRTVGTGLLALCLLTMVKAGVPTNDAVVRRGFDALRQRNITDTYSLSIAIMAIEALYAPADERELLISGRLKQPPTRKLPAADLRLVEGWTARLLQHTDASIKDLAYTRRYYYQPGQAHYDNSNSQYAILGLYSAHLCGVRQSATIWHSMANHWLTDQLADGKKLQLDLTSQQEYAKLRAKEKRNPKSRRTVASRGKKVPPAGWPYSTAHYDGIQHILPLTLSMTAAGITGLTICEAVLRGEKKPFGRRVNPKTVYRRFADARDRGYAWLLDNFSVRCNKHHHGYGFHFYFLYGVERACEIGQIALIGNRDWYFEGSTMILGMLDKGKLRTGMLYANCFAILFLKQAAPPLPTITGRRR